MMKLGPVKCRKLAGCEAHQEWDDKGRSGLLGFCISYSDYTITALQFMYASENNDGNIVFSDSTSGFTGPHSKQVEFDYPSEFLTSVTGSYSSASGISSIKFCTNKAEYGPFGDTDKWIEDRFSFSWGPENKFCGFHGELTSSCLKAIGVYIKPVRSLNTKRPKSEPF